MTLKDNWKMKGKSVKRGKEGKELLKNFHLKYRHRHRHRRKKMRRGSKLQGDNPETYNIR